ncbi:MAG: hypothetical protein WCA39_02940, partial [Nitrososphaeraceae archaeon]
GTWGIMQIYIKGLSMSNLTSKCGSQWAFFLSTWYNYCKQGRWRLSTISLTWVMFSHLVLNIDE